MSGNGQGPAATDANVHYVVRAGHGDRDAFDLVAATVIDGMYSVARLVLRDADRAEDAVQEALVRCWRDLPALRDPHRFEAWARQVLMRAIYDEFRQSGRQNAAVTVLKREPATSDPADDVAIREQLDRGFRRISVDHRSVLVLRLYLGLSIDETAASLGIPAGTAKSRLHHAIDAMRVALEADARPLIGEVSA